MQNLYVMVVFFLIASVAEGRSPTLPPKEVNLADLLTNVKSSTDTPKYEEECPDCPQNKMECHVDVRLDKPCLCFTCLTICNTRDSVCRKGESCVLEDVYYGNATIGRTAVCKPFKECRKVKCRNQCPVSGFFVDVNGCQTCLCNDPCKELKCQRKCISVLSNPGMEPDYFCDADF